MNKQSKAGYPSKQIFIISAFVILGTIGYFLIGSGLKKTESATTISTPSNTGTNASSSAPQPIAPADKVEVVHFHGTQQCWSCITVGEYTLKTIKEKFPEEYASGKIVYKDINAELNENQDIVIKYQARGTSIFTNTIRGETDDISEDVTVWRLVNNESQFIAYFENKLNKLLGK